MGKENTEEIKKNKEQESALKELEDKLKKTASNAAANAKKTMARVGANQDDDLINMTFKAWKDFVVEYNKDKEMNDAVKAAEQKMAAFQKQQKEGATSVVQRMTSANEAGLKQSTFGAWRDFVKETAEKTRMENELNASGGNLKSFASRNKQGAMTVNQRSSMLLDVSTYIFFFTFWKKEVKVELMRRYGERKISEQKNSLVKVKGAVRGFASDLDATLRQGTPPGTSRRD